MKSLRTRLDDGSDMRPYDNLLQRAVQTMTLTFRKRDIGGMFSGRDGILVAQAKQAGGVDDFELVTRLVIQKESSPS